MPVDRGDSLCFSFLRFLHAVVRIQEEGREVGTIVFPHTSFKKLHREFSVRLNGSRDSSEHSARDLLTDGSVRDLPDLEEIICLILVEFHLLMVKIACHLKDPAAYFFNSIPGGHIFKERIKSIPPDLFGFKAYEFLSVVYFFSLCTKGSVRSSPQIQEWFQMMHHHEIKDLIDQVKVVVPERLTVRDQHLL